MARWLSGVEGRSDRVRWPTAVLGLRWARSACRVRLRSRLDIGSVILSRCGDQVVVCAGQTPSPEADVIWSRAVTGDIVNLHCELKLRISTVDQHANRQRPGEFRSGR